MHSDTTEVFEVVTVANCVSDTFVEAVMDIDTDGLAESDESPVLVGDEVTESDDVRVTKVDTVFISDTDVVRVPWLDIELISETEEVPDMRAEEESEAEAVIESVSCCDTEREGESVVEVVDDSDRIEVSEAPEDREIVKGPDSVIEGDAE